MNTSKMKHWRYIVQEENLNPLCNGITLGSVMCSQTVDNSLLARKKMSNFALLFEIRGSAVTQWGQPGLWLSYCEDGKWGESQGTFCLGALTWGSCKTKIKRRKREKGLKLSSVFLMALVWYLAIVPEYLDRKRSVNRVNMVFIFLKSSLHLFSSSKDALAGKWLSHAIKL